MWKAGGDRGDTLAGVSGMEEARARVIVTGRVQGVFFRAETREAAKRAGVNGWVRNMTDGSVEAVFEGLRQDVLKVIEWCRHGPGGARVQAVDVNWEEPRGEAGFRILNG